MNFEDLCLFCFHDTDGNSVCPYCGHSSSEPLSDIQQLPRGTVLDGRYLVGKALGQGGFGITYLAYDLNLRKKRAIKEFFPEGLVVRRDNSVTATTVYKNNLFSQGVESFYKEAQAVAQFEAHPNIVQIYSFFRENNTAYFVMEYIDGITLSEYLVQHGGKIRYEEALKILEPVADALTSLHHNSLLHRDVKPENICITKNGQVKLLDFGSARFETGTQSQHTAAIITPGYAPPEQYSKNSAQGPSTDIYALAATLYRAVTGIIPSDAAERLVNDEMLSPEQTGINIPANVSAAIMHSLALKKQDRPQSIEEFQKELSGEKKVPQCRKENSMPVSYTGITAKQKTRRSIAIISSSAVAFLLFLSVIISLNLRSKAVTSSRLTSVAYEDEIAEAETSMAGQDASVKKNQELLFTAEQKVSTASMLATEQAKEMKKIIKNSTAVQDNLSTQGAENYQRTENAVQTLMVSADNKLAVLSARETQQAEERLQAQSARQSTEVFGKTATQEALTLEKTALVESIYHRSATSFAQTKEANTLETSIAATVEFVLLNPEKTVTPVTQDEENTQTATVYTSTDNYDSEIIVGTNEFYKTVNEAMDAIQENAGDVVIRIKDKAILPSYAEIPIDINISSVTFAPFTPGQYAPVSVWSENMSFFANGIPLIIEKNVSFTNTSVFGGCRSAEGKTVTVPHSDIKIYGQVSYLYAGGMSKGGKSVSKVGDADILIAGSVDRSLYCGGYSEGGSSEITGTATITIDRDAIIRYNVYYGGRAYGLNVAGDEEKRQYRSSVSINKLVIDIKGEVRGQILKFGSIEKAHQDAIAISEIGQIIEK